MGIKKSVYLTDATLAALEGADSISGGINRTIERYAELIRRTTHALADRFTPREMDAIRDCANGWLAEPAATIPGGLALEWRDSLPEIASTHDVDGPGVLARLEALTPAEDFALVESIERFWRSVADPESA